MPQLAATPYPLTHRARAGSNLQPHQLRRQQHYDATCVEKEAQVLGREAGLGAQPVCQRLLVTDLPTGQEKVLEVLAPFLGVQTVNDEDVASAKP